MTKSHEHVHHCLGQTWPALKRAMQINENTWETCSDIVTLIDTQQCTQRCRRGCLLRVKTPSLVLKRVTHPGIERRQEGWEVTNLLLLLCPATEAVGSGNSARSKTCMAAETSSCTLVTRNNDHLWVPQTTPRSLSLTESTRLLLPTDLNLFQLLTEVTGKVRTSKNDENRPGHEALPHCGHAHWIKCI